MARFMSKRFVSLAALFLLTSCKFGSGVESSAKSDWEAEESADKPRPYIVDWSCEPKQYGAKAETRIANQEEYCEWKTISTTDEAKVCRFTSSFDESRDFYLNSREQTPFNTIGAARYLVDSCAEDATKRLKKGKSMGKLCTGLPDACVAKRNSDPEICDKVRWATKERFEKNLEYCVDQLPILDTDKTEKPLMQFGLLAEIPENCHYTADDHTEIECTIAKDEDCFSVAGQLRVGLRVYTRSLESSAQLPEQTSCHQPLIELPSKDEEPRIENTRNASQITPAPADTSALPTSETPVETVRGTGSI